MKLILTLLLFVGLATAQTYTYLDIDGHRTTEGIKTVPTDLTTLPSVTDLGQGFYNNRHDVLNLARLDAAERWLAVVKYLDANGVKTAGYYLFTPIQSQFFFPDYSPENKRVKFGSTLIIFDPATNPAIKSNALDTTLVFDYPETALTELTGKSVAFTGPEFVQSERGDMVGVELPQYIGGRYFSTSKLFDGSLTLNDIWTRKDGSVFKLRSIPLPAVERAGNSNLSRTVWELLK